LVTTIKKASLKLLTAIIVLLLLVHATMLYYGLVFVTTTICFSGLLLIIALAVISFIKPANLANIRLLAIILTISLLLGDLSIRYVFKLHLTRKERLNGYYLSEYKRDKLQALIDNTKYGQQPGWYHVSKPYTTKISSQPEFHYLFKYNSWGLTDADTSSVSDHSKNWIITIGDSFTEGVGAPMDSSWPRLLNNIIGHDSAFLNHQVLNAGKAGSDVYFEYMLLKKLVAYYHPKRVILDINTTDIDDIIIRGGSNRFKACNTIQYNKAPWWEPAYASSYIIRSILNNTIEPDWTLTPKMKRGEIEQQSIDSIFQCVQDFKKLGEQEHFKLTISLNPNMTELTEPNSSYEKLAAELSSDSSYYFINLKHLFLSQNLITQHNYQNYYWAQDGHHNSLGYKIWAEIVASQLKNDKLIP